MKENKLIASVVVFKELLDNDKDIYDIIAEFSKAAIIDCKKWVFTPTDLRQILEEVFDFKLPEAVIKATLKKRLIKNKFVRLSNGEYAVIDVNEKINPEFAQNYSEKKALYKKTEAEFSDYIEKKKEVKLTDFDKEGVRNSLNQFLLGSSHADEYSQDISAFILLNKSNSDFVRRINLVKEGVVLYTGIRYTADLNELGVWNKSLTIFLDTEMLFYFIGYNGEIYREIFFDFLKLVREINQASLKKNGIKKIELKYFVETEKEIHKFFHVAGLIMENKVSLDPSKTAMKEIVNGCSAKSDVITKRNKFFIDLKTSGIHLEEDRNYYETPEYNVEGSEIIKDLAKMSKKNGKEFDEEHCKASLGIFTKINVLRKGVSDRGFENSKFILLTGNRYTLYLAKNAQIKFSEKDIPFATDLDFITDKFWFKLKKGFGSSGDIPKSFDAITKAQIILSKQINYTVQEKYTALNEKFKSGQITKEEAISLNYDLRESSLKPEEINEINLKDSITFINNYSIENELREREELNKKVAEGEYAKRELKSRDRKERTTRFAKHKLRAKIFKLLFYVASFIIILGLGYIFYVVLDYFVSSGDTPLGIIGFVISILLIIPIMKISKAVKYANTKIISGFKSKLIKDW